MNTDVIQSSFKASVDDSVQLFPEGTDRYLVFTPFHFDDGDHFVIVLRKNHSGNWVITDEGHTYMHMSYYMDLSSLSSGNRNKIIESNLEKYNVQEEEGRLIAQISDIARAGDVLYYFIRCLISITDISYLSRERVTSTFMEDFKQFIGESVSPDRIEFNYRDKSRDRDGMYKVDCRVNGMERPLHIYAIGNNDKCRDTTIIILQFQKWKVPFFSIGIFEDQEIINRKVLSRFTDFCDRQFSSLGANRDKIGNFIKEHTS